jgi:hypothetical protein
MHFHSRRLKVISTFSSHLRQPSRIRAGIFIILVFLSTTSSKMISAAAQFGEEEWSEPVNLSRAGSSDNPVLVVDSDGIAHVIWLDEFEGYMVVSGDGRRWTSPVPVDLPFSFTPFSSGPQPTGSNLPIPVLTGGVDGNIHALWKERDDSLVYSRVGEGAFESLDSWSSPLQLTESVLDMDIEVDNSDRVHVAYVRPESSELFPPGVYYRYTADDGTKWSFPELLYDSPYFRSTADSQAHVDLAILGEDQISISWDNRLQGRVFSVQSNDGGITWEQIDEIDSPQPEDIEDAVGPKDVVTVSANGILQRFWVAGHENVDCALYGQDSDDGGVTWRSRYRPFGSLTTCLQGFQIVNLSDNGLAMFIESESEILMAIYDGTGWGDLENQRSLSSFSDPQTFQPITYGCLQSMVVGSNQRQSEQLLMVIGCDRGEGGDVWMHWRSSPGLEFDNGEEIEPSWSPFIPVAATEGDTFAPILLPDADGFLHVFWSQDKLSDVDEGGVYYSRYDGVRWSQPSLILTSPLGGPALSPDVALDPLGRLLATWIADQPGNIYFSQASTGRAALSSEWLSPVLLPIARPSASDPRIDVDPASTIHIAYSIPLNEERGVYLITSTDGGVSWHSPVQVFDAVDAGWGKIAKTRFAIGGGGKLHMLWTRYALPPNDSVLSLHYSRSNDNGLTWEDQTEITASSVVSSEIVAIGDRIVHIIWQDESGTLWHQISLDGGLSWARPLRVSNLAHSGVFDVATDGAGRLHLLSIAESTDVAGSSRDPVPFSLNHWIWIGDRWEPGEGLEIDTVNSVRGFSGAVAPDGNLGLVLAAGLSGSNEEEFPSGVFFSEHRLELPEVAPTPLPTLTPTPSPTPSPAATAAPIATPTAVFPTEADSGSQLPIPLESNDPLAGSLLGIIPAGLVVLIVFFVGLRMLRRDRH